MTEIEKNYIKYHTHISAKHKWLDLKLKEVWVYRDLIWLFTKRSFVVGYKQTVLGPAWLFISPVITSFIYAFIFGGIAGMSTDGVPQILFYLSGTAIWNYFSACFNGNANTFTANAGMFGKVYFPRLTIPLSNILSAVLRFAIQFFLVLALVIYYSVTGTVSPNWALFLLFPLILIHLGIMGMGIGILCSSITTKYRDLRAVVGFASWLLMYATPVVYPLSQLDDGIMKTIIMINPVTTPIEIYRYALVSRGTINPVYLAISLAFTLAVAFFGIMVFNKVERNFMDTV